MYTFLERFVLGATPTWRVLLAAFISTPFFLLLIGVYGLGLADTDVRKTLHAGIVLGCIALIACVVVANLIVIARLWPRRDQSEAVPKSTLLIVQLIGIGFTTIAVSIGVLTTGASVVLMGVLAVGVWLFDRRPMVIGYVTVNLLISFQDLGVLLGWWPYAPALTPLSYAQGPAYWWFELVRETLFVCGWSALFTLLWLLIGSLDSITEQLGRLSNTDSLTGLSNRRAFMDVLGTEIDRKSRTGQPLCVVLIDADHFKRVNDEHGHAEGDRVLITVAQLLSTCVRSPTDMACRLGGEEFALILPGAPREQALQVCMRVRDILAGQVFGTKERRFKVTLSMGLVESMGEPIETLIKRADEQLYLAKSGGRDRVCMLEPEGVHA